MYTFKSSAFFLTSNYSWRCPRAVLCSAAVSGAAAAALLGAEVLLSPAELRGSLQGPGSTSMHRGGLEAVAADRTLKRLRVLHSTNDLHPPPVLPHLQNEVHYLLL